ncbi:hypothetical protein B0H10DRAFT_2236530 [Mycena sp. CBHHK59/15]|nr:hypothetical protein B0H10DRAFT_2236530 [Mycena sp. CBHHK59/15]
MPLDQNHHHQPARQGSPAPIVGAIRPCPPDAPVSSDSDEDSPTLEVTKSPNTCRVVQRRKTQPGQPELESLRYDTDIDSNMPASTAPAPSAAAMGSGTAPVAWPPEHVPLLAALESLLAWAVATTALQLEGEEVPPYPPTIQALVRTLCSRASLSPPTSTPTFASVAAAAPLTTPVDSRSTTPPPHIAHHGIRTEPPSPRDLPSAPLHTANFPFKKCLPCRRAHQCSPHRAIYWWLGAPPLSVERPPEVDIVRVLERSVSDGNTASHIQGVSWTLAGHLAIHTRAPFLATQLAPFFPRFDDAFKENFRSFGGFGEKCILDVDTLWTWVVLHGVPAKVFWGVMDSKGQEIWMELTSWGYDKEVLTYHPMVKTGRSRDDEDHLSVKFAFTEDGSAKCLLAQRGLFLFGAHCRATKYRL